MNEKEQPKDVTSKKEYLDWCKKCLQATLHVKTKVNQKSVDFWEKKIEQAENINPFDALSNTLDRLLHDKI
jgi:uncharacterized protein YnzC (UPF0291/DUF896 family)